MHKIKQLWLVLTCFERALWLASIIVVSLSYLLSPQGNWLTLAASLIGVTALIFVPRDT